MLYRSKEYYHRAHQQHVAAAATHRTASIQDNLLVDDAGSINSGMDVVHHHEVC
jgi:hypothetical protein